MCSYSNLSRSRIGRSMMRSPTEVKDISRQLKRAFTFIVPAGFNHPKTRTHVRLLGPCFKTGQMKPYGRQQPRCIVCAILPNDQQQFRRTASSPPWLTIGRARRRQPRRACAATPLSSPSWHIADYNTHRERRATFPRGFSLGPNSC